MGKTIGFDSPDLIRAPRRLVPPDQIQALVLDAVIARDELKLMELHERYRRERRLRKWRLAWLLVMPAVLLAACCVMGAIEVWHAMRK